MAHTALAADALQKAVNRTAAQERLATLQADLVLLAVVAILLGYFVIEQVHYWTRFPKDHVRFKVLVAWLAGLEAMFFAIRFSGLWITSTSVIVGGAGVKPGFLSIWSTVVTTLIEATVEGFFVFRLWLVTKKLWMRWISVFLWAFSFIAHIVWAGMAGAAGRSNIVDDSQQLRVVIIAFWVPSALLPTPLHALTYGSAVQGTFAEGCFVATCLLYELQFAQGRKVINRQQSSSAIGRLASLAMRTSGILVVFELIVAIAVSIPTQPARALLFEVEFSAAIYTVLAAIIVLYTLNWRATVRPPSSAAGAGGDVREGARARAPETSMPTFLCGLPSVGSGGGGTGAGAGADVAPPPPPPPRAAAAGVNVQTVTTSVVHVLGDADGAEGEGAREREGDGEGKARSEGGEVARSLGEPGEVDGEAVRVSSGG
ncbi:hypothetical protein JCM3770_001161 [Rhodotorula araucariae]